MRGDELRLRAGARELDATRPITVDPSALAWTTPSLEQLAGSTYAMADRSHLVGGALGVVDSFDLTFDQNGFAVAVPGCGVASATATIAAGHLAVSAFTAGTNVAGYTPVGGRSCALADLLRAIATARPTIEVRADQLRLQADSIDLQGTKTAGVNASAIEVWQVPNLEQLVGHEYKVAAVIDDGTSQDLTAYVSFGPDSVHISACPKFWLANHPTIVDGRLAVDAPGPNPIERLVDCLLVPTDHLDALVRLVAANPTIEVRGGLLRLTAGTTSVIGVEPGAVDPGSGPVVTPPTAPSPADATTLPPVTARTAPSAPHTPSIDELVGNEYVIDRLSIAGVDQPLTGSLPIRFASDETGVRLSTGACNTVAGYVEVVGDRLASAAVDLGDGRGAGPVGEKTLAGCDAARMAVDDALYAFLPSGPAISVSGDQLTLTSGASTLVGHRQPPVALVGTTWMYQTAFTVTPQGSAFWARQVGSEFQTTLTLANDGTYAVTSICLVSGAYAVAGAVLTLTPTGQASAGGCQGATKERERPPCSPSR